MRLLDTDSRHGINNVAPIYANPTNFDNMATAEALDSDISDLKERLAILKAHRANLSSILLSHPHLPARLEQRPVPNERKRRNAAKLAQKQANRNLENIYRACAGVTAYKVKDPDPYAVDDGNVLGVRIDVSVGPRFVETYHVLLNRPNADNKTILKIHKHTIPPCIPLQALAKKWLPMARKSAGQAPEQDLVEFGRRLRRELVGWHMRVDALKALRKEAHVDEQNTKGERATEEPAMGRILNAFVSDDEESSDEDASSEQNDHAHFTHFEADAAVREITVTWSNGRVGMFKVTKDGEVDKAIVREKDGTRNVSLSRKAIGRIEELVKRLQG